MPAASDPHSPLLFPTSNLLDLDTLLPHIGQCLCGDDHCDDGEDDDDDIYIMMQCLSVCHENHHFLLGVSCDHLNYP